MGGRGKAAAQQQQATAAMDKNTAKAQAALKEGRTEGREKFGSLSGMDFEGVGDMMKTSIGQAEDNLDRYSGKSDQIRQRGNQAAMQARARSGNLGGQSRAEQAAIGNAASQGAANQRYGEEMDAQSVYRKMSSALMSNAATMEQGYGSQQMASVGQLSQMDMPQQKGLFK